MRAGSTPATRTIFYIMKLATSPDRHTFQAEQYVKRCEEAGEEPNEDYLDLYKSARQRDEENMTNPDWAINNLEHDLRSCEWLVDKCQKREEYAQNLYAAMCNRSFQRNDVWPRLQGQSWSCSWRSAGGIVAHLVGEGDYIDWYCSGIRGGVTENDVAKMSPEHLAKHQWYEENYVSESVVTDEIREDLFKLGWIVLDDDIDVGL